jgi:DNA-binding MarR family transcriptional regulator
MVTETAAVSANEIEKRWTPTLIRSKGFTPISTFFLDNYHRLEPTLTSLEAMVVIHLIRHKWTDKHPYPSFTTLARRMGVTATATRNHARSLEKKRYLNRIPIKGESNRFDLSPLFDALERLYLADEEAKQAKLSKELPKQDHVQAASEPLATVVLLPDEPLEMRNMAVLEPDPV